MEFDNSAFSAFLFKVTEARPIAASSPELTYFTASIVWEIRENIIRIKRERLSNDLGCNRIINL